ncbi:MAG: type II toxin-antitoxin system RelE/ParE family toxin [Planctomycetes bacterium]|nr:type II toxin-antitoxin system RelE/ParE family toxin [Planctomycetota bacterium]
MTFDIILGPSVEAEIEEAYAWIAKCAPQAAAAWYNGRIDAMQSMAEMPERCPLAPESRTFGREIRQLLYGNYRILFTVEATAVHVAHVRHGARRPLRPPRRRRR